MACPKSHGLVGDFNTEPETSKPREILQPDVGNTGGIMEAMKIAAMAEAYDMRIQPHNCGSPVLTAASLQVDACISNFIAACPATHAHLMGYTNGSIGYFPEQKAYAEGGYEIAVTHLDPAAERIYLREIAELMKRFR